jgi:hypothetical protein
VGRCQSDLKTKAESDSQVALRLFITGPTEPPVRFSMKEVSGQSRPSRSTPNENLLELHGQHRRRESVARTDAVKRQLVTGAASAGPPSRSRICSPTRGRLASCSPESIDPRIGESSFIERRTMVNTTTLSRSLPVEAGPPPVYWPGDLNRFEGTQPRCERTGHLRQRGTGCA